MAVTRIAEIPLHEREVLELLALEHDRIAVDADYAGFGWAAADAVTLDAPDRPPIVLRDVVVLALHSADLQPDDADIELLFELPEQSVIVPLSAFLPHALAQLPAGRDVVLALCNPGQVQLPSAGRPLYYALGDVTSWLDHDGPRPSLRLSARRWRHSEEAP